MKKCEEINQSLTAKFREMFLRPPYVLYSFFLKISDENLSTEDSAYLDNCLSMIK